jgi:quercetin dioxygenase-like cupin family protein
MTDMKYVRLFAGPDGENHFEDVAIEFNSEPPLRFLVSEWETVERIRYLNVPPSLPGVSHHAPSRLLHVVLAGEWRMQTSDGETRYFRAGDIILVEDTTGKGHMTSTEDDGAIVARIEMPS